MRRSPQLDLITPSGPRSLDRVVVGIDFSEVSLAAAQWVARHLARDAALTLVHVIPPSSPDRSTRCRGRGKPIRRNCIERDRIA